MGRTCLAVGIALALPVAALAAEPLEGRFSRDYVFLVSVNDAVALKAAFEKTAFWTTWNQPEVQACLEQALTKLQEAIKEHLGLTSRELFASMPGQAVLGVAPPIWNRRREAGREPPDAAEGGAAEEEEEFRQGRVVCLIRLGAAKATADRILAQIRKEIRPDAIRQIKLADGTPCEQFGRYFLVAAKDDLLGISNHAKSLGEALKGVPAAAQLVETPSYKATMKPLGPQPPEAVYTYLDIPRLLRNLRREEELDTDARRSLDRLGLLEMKGLAWSARPVGQQFVSQAHVCAPGWTEGLLTPFGREARALLRTVPPEALGAFASRFDAKALYDTILGAASAAGDEDSFDRARTLRKFRREYGVDLRLDLLKPLGTDLVLYVLPQEDPPLSMLPRLVLEVPVRQREALVRALDRIAKTVAADLPASLRYRREEAGGTVWHTFWSLTPSIQVAAGVGETRLVVATRKADAEAALARGGRPLERSFLDRPEVAQALDRVGGDGAIVSYCEVRPVLSSLYSCVAALAPAPGRTGDEAPRTQCMSNLRQLGKALRQYAETHDGNLPASLDDLAKLDPPVAGNVLRCPATGLTYHYIRRAGKKLADLEADAILAYELMEPHEELRNVLSVNGSVRSVAAPVLAMLLANVPADLRAKDPAPGEVKPGPLQPTLVIPGLGPLPSADVLFKHFTPRTVCVRVNPDGLVYTCESFASPLTSLSPPSAFLGAWGMLRHVQPR